MSSYQEQFESELWDSIAGGGPRDLRRRTLVIGELVCDRNVEVRRIVGTRSYVVSVDGFELPGYHDWTVDALNAGRAAARAEERGK